MILRYPLGNYCKNQVSKWVYKLLSAKYHRAALSVLTSEAEEELKDGDPQPTFPESITAASGHGRPETCLSGWSSRTSKQAFLTERLEGVSIFCLCSALVVVACQKNQDSGNHSEVGEKDKDWVVSGRKVSILDVRRNDTVYFVVAY